MINIFLSALDGTIRIELVENFNYMIVAFHPHQSGKPVKKKV